MPPQVFVFGFLHQNLGWFLLAAAVIAAVGLVSLASREARERRVSSRILVAAAILAVGTLLVYAVS